MFAADLQWGACHAIVLCSQTALFFVPQGAIGFSPFQGGRACSCLLSGAELGQDCPVQPPSLSATAKGSGRNYLHWLLISCEISLWEIYVSGKTDLDLLSRDGVAPRNVLCFRLRSLFFPFLFSSWQIINCWQTHTIKYRYALTNHPFFPLKKAVTCCVESTYHPKRSNYLWQYIN